MAAVIAVGLLGVVGLVVAVTMERQTRAMKSVGAASEALGLRQELREVVDCPRTLQGINCSVPFRSQVFPMRNKIGTVLGRARGQGWLLGDWTVRATCQSNVMTVEAAQLDARGQFRKDALSDEKVLGWRPILTSAELECGDRLKTPPPAECITGPDSKLTLCPRSVWCTVSPVGDGTLGCFAACAKDEMPYACGFVAAAAYTIGKTFAEPSTQGGLPGCQCNIGSIDHCTGGTSPSNGCSSSCAGLCVRAP